MPIYTRTGDHGETSLYGGQRILKSSVRVETYGTVDELNSAIGVAIATDLRITNKELRIKKELLQIQNDLLLIGSTLANPEGELSEKEKGNFVKRVKEFEKAIDRMDKELPTLRNFILPGGGQNGAFLHFVRTIARRGERMLVRLSERERVEREIITYMNRLSDLLFTYARFVNYKEGQKEHIWTKVQVR